MKTDDNGAMAGPFCKGKSPQFKLIFMDGFAKAVLSFHINRCCMILTMPAPAQLTYVIPDNFEIMFNDY